MKRRTFVIGIMVATVLTAGLTAFGVIKLTSKPSTKTIEYVNSGAGAHFTSYEREKYPDLTYAAENAVQAVVNVEKTEEVKTSFRGRRNPLLDFFGIPDEYYNQPNSRERRSGGSGVIISSDGYIVTNNHVIENASKLRVTLNDNSTYDAEIIGTDPTTDVALIKIDENNLPALPFGDSDKLRLGEWVLAIGSPFDLRSTVTAGIVSAKGRNLSVIPNQFSIESFIQTDAAVNPGNSGGALVNVMGELVGINTVIKSPTGSFAGYSFAVPASIAKKVTEDLKQYGIVQRAMLGITFQEINDMFIEEYGEEYGISKTGGVYVFEVSRGGAAEAAGIKKGDIITEIGGQKVTSAVTITEQVAKHRPGDKITLSLNSGGQVKHMEVVLRNKVGKAELLKEDYVDAVEVLGGQFAQITDAGKKKLNINGGIQVISIKEGGLLSRARIRKGYIITHINDKEIHSVSDLNRVSKISTIDGVYPDGRAASFALVE